MITHVLLALGRQEQRGRTLVGGSTGSTAPARGCEPALDVARDPRYVGDYNTARPHHSLDNNSPRPRVVEPPPCGRIVAVPQIGGLHHRYQRVA